MRHARLLDEVRALRWPARRRVQGAMPGSHLARLRGPGGEFSEYRAYRQGDDPRRLDWRLLARSDRAYVRLADDHALLPTWLVLDASASMAFPGDDLATGEAVWGKWRLAEALAAVAPAGSPPLAPLVRRLAPGVRLVLVSDFLGDDADATRRAAAALAAAGAEVHAVHVVAREELEPPREAQLVEDPEDATVRRPMDAAARRAYTERFAAWRGDVAREWREAGAMHTLVSTAESPARAVRRVVQGVAAGAEAGS